MSGSETPADRIRKRQDKIARGEARKAKQARMEARSAAEKAAIEARQQQLVADAKAAREASLTSPKAAAKTHHGDVDRPGRDRDVAAIADRLEAREARQEQDRQDLAARRKAQAGRPFGPKVEIGVRSVPDPLEPGAKIEALVNLAEHPLEMMLSRGRLSPSQYAAACRYREVYERAAIGPGRAIDPAKIKVDGGGVGDPLSDAVLDAHQQLKQIAAALGDIGNEIVRAIAGEGRTVTELAVTWTRGKMVSEKLRRAYLAPRFCEALDVLAEEVWGATGPNMKPGKRILSARDLGSGVIDEKAVAVANQRFLNRRGVVGLE